MAGFPAVFWPRVFGFLAERGGCHFSHYCSLAAWHVKDGKNQYRYSNKDSSSTKSMPFIWCKAASTSHIAERARMPLPCERGRFTSRVLYVEQVACASSPPAHTAPVSRPSGRCERSDGSELKPLWQGYSHQIPWQLPQQPPPILPCHMRKEITEWIKWMWNVSERSMVQAFYLFYFFISLLPLWSQRSSLWFAAIWRSHSSGSLGKTTEQVAGRRKQSRASACCEHTVGVQLACNGKRLETKPALSNTIIFEI